MNVNDVEKVEDDGSCRLEQIFDKQKMLMKKYHIIEEKNWLLLDHKVPVDIHDKRGQARLKDFKWRITEELMEAGEALFEKDMDHAREEVADAFHFLVELCILSGVEILDIVNSNQVDSFGDKLDELFFGKVAEIYEKEVYEFLLFLGKAANTLKNKPWKQTQMLTDVPRYKQNIICAFHRFIGICLSVGMVSQDLFELYYKKSEVNKFRQRSNY